MWRQRRIARWLKWTVLKFCKRIVCHERGQMRHRQRPIKLVNVRFRQIEKLEKQLEKIFRTIGLYFQPHGIAPTGASQLLLDCAQEVLRFLVINVEIAVASDAKRVHAVQD